MVSSISPQNPYADDEITINGTGFNTDAKKDTVDFGLLSGNVFTPLQNQILSTQVTHSNETNIVSATATKIIIKSKNPRAQELGAFQTNNPSAKGISDYGLDYMLFWNTNTPNIKGSVQIRVRSNGNVAYSPVTQFKQIPSIGIYKIESTLYQAPNWIQVWTSVPLPGGRFLAVGDSVEFFLNGVYGTTGTDVHIGLSCTVSNCSSVLPYIDYPGILAPPCDCNSISDHIYGNASTVPYGGGRLINYDAAKHTATFRCKIPGNFFGTTYSGGAPNSGNWGLIPIKLLLTNIDNKTDTIWCVLKAKPNHS
ncbi:MAG: hypothetical protein JST47_12750 [Bacteroidetes bacterium]|nr:hypothetical protein [Bacteroidota bacterium]